MPLRAISRIEDSQTMNIRSGRTGSVLLVLSLGAFATLRAVQTQSVEPPPVKMGLWQTESNTSTAGMENTPMARAGGKHSTVSQGCLTPETWKSELAKIGDNPDCKVSNMHQDAHSISFDETCASERHNTNAHFEGQFDDSEHMHGTVKVQITSPSFPQPITMNMALTSHYLSSSCGDVKPGEGKVIRHE